MAASQRIATGVDWASAPEWLTIQQACALTNRTALEMLDIIEVDGVDLKDDSADLKQAFLKGACLQGMQLANANLEEADLRESNLRDASLIFANLSKANLTGADLSGANLSQANLQGAQVTSEQLSTVKHLAGTIMPDGTKHEQ